ncbi:unnamed protein product [Nesidiocoris tenuis]|uniref:Uncharacterized protein n=1 Tax=Nesidiocoris tenuis TaxID=355587 RepID=A0A6H5GQQ7_9HEMI|nr:unnamed protein product [Nesidiocoris tenuis]
MMTVPVSDVCSRLREKNQLYSIFTEAMHPPMPCPFKKELADRNEHTRLLKATSVNLREVQVFGGYTSSNATYQLCHNYCINATRKIINSTSLLLTSWYPSVAFVMDPWPTVRTKKNLFPPSVDSARLEEAIETGERERAPSHQRTCSSRRCTSAVKRVDKHEVGMKTQFRLNIGREPTLPSWRRAALPEPEPGGAEPEVRTSRPARRHVGATIPRTYDPRACSIRVISCSAILLVRIACSRPQSSAVFPPGRSRRARVTQSSNSD